jgi:sortase family protein
VTQRVLFSAALGALLAGAALVACTTTAQVVEDLPSGGAAASSVEAPEFVEVAEPTVISIPAIGVQSSLLPYGLTDTGELAVPPVTEPLQAGYFGGLDPEFTGDEYLPGENGPAVVMGHVDGVINGQRGMPGIFYRLRELVPGNEILIDRADRSQLTFVVTRVERYAKAAFDTEAVYGPTQKPELRAITCGGAFDRAAGHYVDNWVIFAELASGQQT